ncbi:metal dependent phosphohydrolase [Candidatus Magnetoovum chiemensis]|nr:metal dependent phosphohydrolase [Candidatus Magnetoovum chiemensis]
MKKRIKAEDLKVGMYVVNIVEDYLRTPFWSHSFLIKNEKTIRQINELGIKYVYIDTERCQIDVAKVPEAQLKPIDETPKELDQAVVSKKSDAPDTALPYTKEELKNYYKQLNNYFQIDEKTLLNDSFIPFSLYLKRNLKIEMLLEYKGKEIEITENILEQKGEILVLNKDRLKYREYLKSLISPGAKNLGISRVQLKNIYIKESSKILTKELLEDPRSGEKIKESKIAVEELVDSIQKNKGIVSGLLTIGNHDYYTYTHTVNVCVFSLGVALEIGGMKDDDLYALGMGCILHDIGKSKIPLNILNKPSKLSDDEFTIMRQHVLLGKKIAQERNDLPKKVMYPIVEHHEKMTGKGYPNGLSKDGIHLFGRIVAISDVYDALTTARPYKTPFPSFDAMTIMRKSIEDFDQEVFAKFIIMLGNINYSKI